MENNPVAIKSSVFGGFKKKDVLSYIFELNESTQESQQRFAEQIEELDQSRAELSADVARLESRLASVQAELDSTAHKLDLEQAKYQEASEMLEEVRAGVQKRENELKEKESEVLRLSSLNSELKNKNRILEEKQDQVELAASQIANLLSEAKVDADKVVADARDEAAKAETDARRQADRIIEEAKNAAQKYIDDANRSTGEVYGKFGAFMSELESLGKTISGLSESAAKLKADMPEKLDFDPNAALLQEKVSRPENKEPAFSENPVDNTSDFTREVLGRYGVRKDNSGFFRLAAEKK